MSTTVHDAIRIVEMPDIGGVTDTSSFVGERAGSGRFNAPAVANYVLARAPTQSGMVSVKTYGAIGDGATDDTAAVNAAIAACPGSGGALYFPPGVYNIGSPIVVTKNLTMRGAGRFASTLKATTATGHVIDIRAPVEVCDLGFDASVTRSDGAYVNFGADSTRSRMSRFYMLKAWIGINVDAACGGDVTIMDGEILDWVANATAGAIQIAGQEITNVAHCYIEQGLRPGIGFGIKLLNGGGVFQDVDIACSGIGLVMAPGSGQTATAAWFDHCFFDNCQIGVSISPTGTGAVRRNRFANCWICSSVDQGMSITSPVVSSVDGNDFTNCFILGNGVNGVQFSDANARNTSFANCQVAGNLANGINFFAGGTAFSIIGCRIGTWGGFGANVGAGINLGAACAQYRIVDNDLSGNTGGALVGAGVQTGGSPGRSEMIGSNIGYADSSYWTIGVGPAATSTTIAHGLAAAPPIHRVMLTALTGIGTAGSYWVSAVTATELTVSVAAAPGVAVSLAYQAKLACTP